MARNVDEPRTTASASEMARGSRRSLILDDPTEDIADADELIDWIRQDPENRYNLLRDRIWELLELREDAARQAPNAKDQMMEEEYARLRTENETLQKEKDSLLTVMNMIRDTPVRPVREEREASVASTAAFSGKKSTKMPDPPIFSDGKEIKFKDWKAEMKRKLLLNEDHYPTPAHQLAYVSSRCEGKALRHINPRMQEEAVAAYRTAQDVFDHLQSVFHDPNHQQVARDEYLALKMEPKQDFGDFLAEFTYLAEEANQPEDLRKRDLYRKLPNLLQNQVMIDAGQDSVSLEAFIQKCQIASRLISQQISNRAEARGTNKNGRSGGNTNSRQTPNTSTNDRKPTSPLDDKEKAKLLKEGRCFVCREQGHVSRNCPTKTATTTAATSNQDDKKKDLKEAETDESDESGKE